MSQKPNKSILLIDYENIQNIDPSVIQEPEIDIKFFVGQTQKKLNDQEIYTLVDTLFVQKKISEASNHLTYNF